MAITQEFKATAVISTLLTPSKAANSGDLDIDDDCERLRQSECKAVKRAAVDIAQGRSKKPASAASAGTPTLNKKDLAAATRDVSDGARFSFPVRGTTEYDNEVAATSKLSVNDAKDHCDTLVKEARAEIIAVENQHRRNAQLSQIIELCGNLVRDNPLSNPIPISRRNHRSSRDRKRFGQG